jgi:GR25 family glycosyltransferase involved in LPS biosynthesis
VEKFNNIQSSPIKGDELEVYLINLDRNKDRLEAFIEQYMKCDLRGHQIKRLSAVDGQKIANIEERVTLKALEEIQEVEKTGYRTKHYQLTRGAVGCYLSHMQVYELIANSNTTYGMIFEDDVVIDKKIFKKLNDVIVHVPNDWDMLLLSCHCIVCEKMDMYYDTGKFFWLHCYIVKKDSAQKILTYLKSNKIGKQIDSELSDMIGDGLLKVYCLKESLCKQGNVFQTTIQTPLKVVPGINPYAAA